jgi:hypothetical protein
MLKYYDNQYEPVSERPLKTFHNGYSGGSFEDIFYIRNSDPAVYYSDIYITPKFRLKYLKDSGVNGNTGWSIKVLYGKSKPTRSEWDTIESGEEIVIPDIGSEIAADTSTFHPIWFRVFCPGGEEAQIRENIYFEISFNEKQVRL